jgi:hypothetical protein
MEKKDVLTETAKKTLGLRRLYFISQLQTLVVRETWNDLGKRDYRKSI